MNNTWLKRFKKICKFMVICSLLPLLFACENTPKPWVKPYERNNLTLPVMDWALDPVADSYMDHVYQAREGARGAEGTSGGGCGCN